MKHVLVWDLCACELLIETFIFINRNITLLTSPDSSKRVDHGAIQLNRIADELRELLDNLLDSCVLGELAGLRHKLNIDSGASVEVKVIYVGNFKSSHAIGDPFGTFI